MSDNSDSMRWNKEEYYISRNYWNANDNADFTECARCGSKRTKGHIGKRAYKDNCCPHCYSFYRNELEQTMAHFGISRAEVTKMLKKVEE